MTLPPSKDSSERSSPFPLGWEEENMSGPEDCGKPAGEGKAEAGA